MPSNDKREWSENTLEPLKKRFGERRERVATAPGLDVDAVCTPAYRGRSRHRRALGRRAEDAGE